MSASLRDPARLPSPCAECTRGCCFEYTVTVTGYDVFRLARGLRLAPEQFLVALPQPEPNGQGFQLDRTEQRFHLALDKLRIKAESRPCVFWIGFPSGVGRCGVYPWRPAACRTYPAYFHQGQVRLRDDVLCPDGAWSDGRLRQPSWADELRQTQVEFDIYRLAVARWNYHVEHTPHLEQISLLGFYSYVMSFYGRLEPLRRKLDDSQQRELYAGWAGLLAQNKSPLLPDEPAGGPWGEHARAIIAVAQSFFPSDP